MALLDDGRVATKRFVDVSDDTANSGAFKGYSTYIFQNGDTLTLSYTGGWDAKGAGGDYTVVSGTGASRALPAPASSRPWTRSGTRPRTSTTSPST